MRRRRAPLDRVDQSTRVGSIELPSPIMNASGCAGHADELAPFVDLGSLGAFVAKSLCVDAWEGNPGPRVHMTPSGMINAVGLQGPGIEAWLQDDLPLLRKAGVRRVVVSIWGTDVSAYQKAATMLHNVAPEIIAVEVNLSCPNTHAGRGLFAHDPKAAAQVVSTCVAALDRPVWAKLSPNTDALVDVAAAVQQAGAEAVTLVNTYFGLVIDVDRQTPVLGNGGGGVSGPAIHPMAVRAVYDVRAALADLAIVGVGGVASARDALELLEAGANAIQIGTAAFADPKVLSIVANDLKQWCATRSISSLTQIIGAAHESK